MQQATAAVDQHQQALPGEAAPGDTIRICIDPDMAELIPLFLENRSSDVREIQEALGRGDFALIGRLGHSMKGVGVAYGFDAVTEIGAAIEQAAKAKDAVAVQRWVNDLATYLRRVEVV